MRHTITLRGIAAGSLITSAAALALASDDERPAPEELFVDSGQCMACHNRLLSVGGDDAAVGTSWRSSMMAHAAADPYWQAGVRREILDHPKAQAAIEDKCATCHMPMNRFVAHQNGRKGGVFVNLASGMTQKGTPEAALAADGVSCAVCHQISPNNLGSKASFTGNFEVDTATPAGQRAMHGPFDISPGTTRIMQSATGYVPQRASHIQRAAHCASCHTLYTHALDENGHPVAELAEQVPYLEWLHSSYSSAKSCQDCHMDPVDGDAPISSVLGKPRSGLAKHVFWGGNFFLLRLLGRNGGALGLSALPGELSAAARTTAERLKEESARISIDTTRSSRDARTVTIPVVVENTAGHKLPTAYPSRRVWIHLTVRDDTGKIVFESGALDANGAVVGNDNDADPARFEPHYDTIYARDQVQIYEAIMGAPDGTVTTGLLRAASYLKDNRLLPSGFDKQTAHHDIAVVGNAGVDPSFAAGRDRVVYQVPLHGHEGSLHIAVELWYQPIGYRWAMNLAVVNAEEPRRFLSMYRAMPAAETAILLVKSEATLGPTSPDAAPHDGATRHHLVPDT